ncbi:MAG: ABC transporter substrate-binding protein [Lachnospiraceae bacterium]|nr:ABC transporter substrate-binding protein [Lachnospiraceae bacterium]MDY5701772.1 ABC transporter substrate-binding protein [Lachnospiraceae bacterium]
MERKESLRKAEKRTGGLAAYGLVLLISLFILTGCGSPGGEAKTESFLERQGTAISSQLVYESTMDLEYAKQFRVDFYQEGYALIRVADGRSYLVIPKGKGTPTDLEPGITVLKQPLTNIYMVATAAMDMFCELDALSALRFSSQRAEGWSREEARAEMEKGNILYAGKYSMPDYELIVSEGCSLAVENNMISHSPEVIEKLESFDIPVFIDFSSYENHPLGRVEWVKVYGVLLNSRERAQELFASQVEVLDRVEKKEASGKRVAFFFITTNGMVNVRSSSDYVPKMIELAGGKYAFENLPEKESSRSSVNMTMEEFYERAREADYLIYNSTIDGELLSVEELLAREKMLADFKAVQEGNVWCTTKDLYQQSMSIGGMIEDFHRMLSGEEGTENMQYMYKLE